MLDFVPFGFGNPVDVFLAALLYLLSITLAVVAIKYAVMLTIVDTIPLWANLWIFEWTRKIAMVVIDLLIGLWLLG
ncbi:hypothetical protein [Stygiolobus sp. RP850M]|uniref:hypothetical protein n=1 Tax=Stygiolobus sp. RP850M TaxID=3133137 RepID=UPI00307D628A